MCAWQANNNSSREVGKRTSERIMVIISTLSVDVVGRSSAGRWLMSTHGEHTGQSKTITLNHLADACHTHAHTMHIETSPRTHLQSASDTPPCRRRIHHWPTTIIGVTSVRQPNQLLLELNALWTRKRVPKCYQRCSYSCASSSWGCCYQVFKVLRLFHFTTDRH